MATVVNVKKAVLQQRGYRDFTEWAAQPNHVYIARNMSFYVPGTVQSKWANPYSVKSYDRDGALAKYHDHLMTSGLINDIMELDGKELGCWCKPDACHGDILADYLQRYKAYLASFKTVET